MKPVSELYGLHDGEDIYVVGTGTSLRVFPLDLLEGRITIGLNSAWKAVPVRYSITLGPHSHVPEFNDLESHPEIVWITKRKKAQAVLTPEQFAYAEEHFYNFSADGKPNGAPLEEPSDAGRIVEWVRNPTGNCLYQWSSISQTACNLAANLGARNIILVGCDNASLEGNHHAMAGYQTKWLGSSPERRYQQYWEGLVEVRAALRERGVNLVSMSPFLKLADPQEDFHVLCRELEQPTQVVAGADISAADHPGRFAVPKRSFPRRAAARARALLRKGR